MEKLPKATKPEKWKTIKVPESLWRVIRIEAAKNDKKLYKEIATRYGLKL